MDTNEMGMEAQARRSGIEAWAKASGLDENFLEADLIWSEDGTAMVEGPLMLANTEATRFPEGLQISEGAEVYVRADQTVLKADLESKGIIVKEVADPRAEMKEAA